MTATDVDVSVSPFLQGAFTPIQDELDVGGLTVEGELPPALRGSYMRNGANPAFTPPAKYHIFDGDGMVHAVELGDGDVRYRNRFVESKGLTYERAQGHAVFGGLSGAAQLDPRVVEEIGFAKNTANTNVIRHAGRVLALMEGGRPTELTWDLDTVGEYDFDGALPFSMTAHPKVDPRTGELVFFTYLPMAPHVSYYVADAAGTLTTNEIIETPRPTMMHDFVMTARHIVFFDMPAVMDLQAMMTGDGTSISWQPQFPARVGVMPRDGGNDDVQWFELDPFYVFHFVNGWEDDAGRVQVVGCRAPGLLTSFGDEPAGDVTPPVLWQWTIDPAAGTIDEQQLDDRPTDFPRINDAYAGTASRFGYLAHSRRWDERVEFDGIIKYDLEGATSTVVTYPAPIMGGEPVFAPDPDGSAEDDGWLLNLVTDHEIGKSELVVHDAHDLEVVARVHLPQRVPSGFHGNWMPR